MEIIMNTRRKVEAKISQKEKEIQSLETQLAEANAELKGMKEILKILPREAVTNKNILRSGSMADKAYKALNKAGQPLYIDDILQSMKKAVNKKNRVSISSVLSQYARKHEIFSRPAPNTFGLLEWGVTITANQIEEGDTQQAPIITNKPEQYSFDNEDSESAAMKIVR